MFIVLLKKARAKNSQLPSLVAPAEKLYATGEVQAELAFRLEAQVAPAPSVAQSADRSRHTLGTTSSFEHRGQTRHPGV
jgi:hypothetical protein